MNTEERLRACWLELYPNNSDGFSEFWNRLVKIKEEHFQEINSLPARWFRDGTAYVAYVDHFADDFTSFTERLDYLKELGVDILWLLPCLDSPMVDQGFDISDFEKVRPSLQGKDGERAFDVFLDKATKLGIRVIFDVTVNHCSNEHPWFKEAASSKESAKRSWFFWSDDEQRFAKARLLFKGMVDSNWEKSEETSQYYFHRFYPCQPDLNYQNPEVLDAMLSVFANWRASWRQRFSPSMLFPSFGRMMELIVKTGLGLTPSSSSFELPSTTWRQTHCCLLRACQPPKEVVQFFGQGDECHASLSLSSHANDLSCLDSSKWPMHQRCVEARSHAHHSRRLPMVSPFYDATMNSLSRWLHLNNAKRYTTISVTMKDGTSVVGEGISARLFDLCQGNLSQVLLAFSLLFTLPGTPIIYYGDELALANDEKFFEEKSKETGFKDSRFFVRGKIDWVEIEKKLNDKDSLPSQTLGALRQMIATRKATKALTRGNLEFPDSEVFAIERSFDGETVLCLHNLGNNPMEVTIEDVKKVLYSQNAKVTEGTVTLAPYGFCWLT